MCESALNGVIPRDYGGDRRYSLEYSCGTLLFISWPRLRCKPRPDEINVTTVNMSRWERSVPSLKIVWRSVHNELHTLEFPWNILFWTCKRWLKLLSVLSTEIPEFLQYFIFSILYFSMLYFFSFVVVSYIIQPYRSSSRRHLIIHTKADPTKGLTIKITEIILNALYSANNILMYIPGCW
jgi:hypothetical protein